MSHPTADEYEEHLRCVMVYLQDTLALELIVDWSYDPVPASKAVVLQSTTLAIATPLQCNTRLAASVAGIVRTAQGRIRELEHPLVRVVCHVKQRRRLTIRRTNLEVDECKFDIVYQICTIAEVDR